MTTFSGITLGRPRAIARAHGPGRAVTPVPRGDPDRDGALLGGPVTNSPGPIRLKGFSNAAQITQLSLEYRRDTLTSQGATPTFTQ